MYFWSETRERNMAKKDTTMNYTKYLMNQTLSVTPELNRLGCEGHLMCMNNDRTLKKHILNTKPDGVRRVGRPKLRWEDGVDQDMRILEVKNWKKVALDTDEWAKRRPGHTKWLSSK